MKSRVYLFRAILLFCISVPGLLPLSTYAQRFWLTTYAFPGGPKTGITLTDDSCLIVGLTQQVMRSCDNAYTWDITLNSTAIYTVFTASNGRVLAGGNGKVFYSNDRGASWDSVSLNHTYPVTKFIQNTGGQLFAITGTLDLANGFVGSGVFYSGNNGSEWSARNTGLGSYLCVEQIAHDKNGRLYLTVADEYVSGNAGLYISDNQGQLWERIPINIDGRNAVNDRIKVGRGIGLSVSPQDTVYLSIDGVADNSAVSLNLHKSITDIRKPDKWLVDNLGVSSTWWDDWLLYDIHFSKKGDWYSSMSGSPAMGGTYFSKNFGGNWTKHQQGLGYDWSGRYNKQYFAETENGKIFMVQLLDERIYWADTSVLSFRPQPGISQPISVFPNPAPVKGQVMINWTISQPVDRIILQDISGRVIYEHSGLPVPAFTAPGESGMYLIRVFSGSQVYAGKLVVR